MNPNDILQQQQAMFDQMQRTQQISVVMLIVYGVIGLVVFFLLSRWLYYTVEHFRELAEAHFQLVSALKELARTAEKYLQASRSDLPTQSTAVEEPPRQTKPSDESSGVRVDFSKR